MSRRLLCEALVAMVVFALWTSVVRDGIAHGSRESAWLGHRFGDWPEEARDVRGTSDIQFSIFATYASSVESREPRGAMPDLFGRPVIGSVIDQGDSEIINGSRFTTGVRSGAVSSISVFVGGPIDAPPHDQFQLAIYEDSRGAPSDLLSRTRSGRLAPDAWNTLPIQAVLQPKTTYWLMYNTNGTNGSVNNPAYTPIAGTPLDGAIRSYGPPRFQHEADLVTAVAQLTPMVLAIVVISLFAARRRPRAAVALPVGFVLVTVITVALKDTMFEPYSSYPSGHVARAAYVAVAFAFVVTWRSARIAAASLVALIGVAAVYSNGHYSEEVIGGALLGWAVATAAKAFAGDPTGERTHLPGGDGRASTDTDVIDITDEALRRSRTGEQARSAPS